MTSSTAQAPQLIFFQETPQNWLDSPPLASSLQNLETSFLLLAIARYPSALVTCASAIESAIQAAFNNLRRKRFELLLEQANSHFPLLCRFPDADLLAFRQKRNEIIHYGFSKDDDEVSALLMLQTGYHLLERCYETFFDFRLKRNETNEGGLWPNFARHLEVAQTYYSRTREMGDVPPTLCLMPLAHAVRWQLQDSVLSSWQREALQDEEEQFERRWSWQESYKRQLLRDSFEISWEFDCPVCEFPSAFLCELEREALNKKDIRLSRAVCVSCGLEIPDVCPMLANELCSEQLVEARNLILKEFGID